MKKSLQDRLKKYGTMAAAVTGVAVVGDADAQVVYHDINPDSTFSNNGDVFNLDLNHDGTVDFQINLSQNSGGGSSWFFSTNDVRINPQGSSNSMVITSNYAAALSSGAAIGSANSFTTSNLMASKWVSTSYYSTGSGSYYTWTSYSSYGNWLGAQDKFLGLKFKIGANTHYGWARLDVSSNADQFTIKDYAYNATANTSINAGDMGGPTSISEVTLLQNINVMANNGQLKINIPVEYIGYNLKVVSMMGQEVINNKLANTTTSFDISSQAKGVYLVLINGNNQAYANKIIFR